MRASFALEGRLRRLEFEGEGEGGHRPGQERVPAGTLGQLAAELAEYFAGVRRSFTVPLAPEGSEFERRVWSELVRVPYGTTVSYGELARRVGRASAARAVGLANARNPLAIVVPCHRVIGADGSLTGYGGGLWRKRALLELEGVRRAGGTQMELDLG
ncbi:MAG: methylated-DNA--[protein]-cysteine S-methyltransferase [Acidobacteriota bacterium]